jgi:hypothetical protein
MSYGYQPVLYASMRATYPGMNVSLTLTTPTTNSGCSTTPPAYGCPGGGVLARNGETVALARTRIDADLATMLGPASVNVTRILFNLGVTNFAALPAQATWEADYAYLLDALHAKYPAALIYCARPWAVGYDAEADTLAGWLATVVAARSPWAQLGHDERVWLKGADNGATMTSDGVHYSYPAGFAAAAAQWMTALGY